MLICKASFKSAVKDTSEKGKRKTYCGKEIEAIKVNGMWKSVTCKECLSAREK